jgi:hypothetical protein
MEGTSPQQVGDSSYARLTRPELDIVNRENGFPYTHQLQGRLHRGLELKRFINGDEQGLTEKNTLMCSYLFSARFNNENSFPYY